MCRAFEVSEIPAADLNLNVDFCKMDIGPIFFKEISFFDFLEESTHILIRAVVEIQEGKIEEQNFSFPK